MKSFIKTSVAAGALIVIVALSVMALPGTAEASEPFLGQIQCFGFNFCPRGWAACEGQLLPIAQYSALFSLLGTMYGGDGRTTFGLPDLRGRVMFSAGSGPGLPNYNTGSKGGAPTALLNVNQMPSHDHPLWSYSVEGDASNPSGNFPAKSERGDNTFHTNVAAPPPGKEQMHVDVIGDRGGSQQFSIMQPYLAVKCCIAVTGLFPSRN